MCGRTTLCTPPDDLQEIFGLDEVPELTPRYNVAPTQPIAVIREPRKLELLRWGLVLPDPRRHGPGINVRIETVARAPAYRDAFRHRRCLVIVDGFYEWQRHEKVRQPFAIRRTDNKPFALAGIWSEGRLAGGEIVACCAILTGKAAGVMVSLHDRMPLLVASSDFARWLAHDATPAQLVTIPAADATAFVTFPVSTAVNSVANEDPRCIEPIALSAAAPATLSLF
jgi:putative SOS response-associated peptidase YedK